MRFLQANMHRGKVAHALLPQIAREQDADIIIISEQYAKLNKGTWYEDESGTAAIWITRPGKFRIGNSGRGNGFVWLQIGHLTIISCYLTPSDNIDLFQGKLDSIEDFVRFKCGDAIVAGDFNSRAIEWGMENTDPRGRRILEMIARLGLTTSNTGGDTTFRRPGCKATIPDVTFISERLARRLKNWKVLEIYTASDHQYISFCLENVENVQIRTPGSTTRRWNVNKLDTAILMREIDRHVENLAIGADARSTVRHTMTMITECCNRAMPKTRKAPKWKPVYWWNATIDEARRNCVRSRRRYTRARRRGDAEAEHNIYKEAKKQLHNHIRRSKKEKWEELRADINKNPWGLGYKIVMQKLGSRNSVETMDDAVMQNIVHTLFPRHDIRTEAIRTGSSFNIPLFTIEELKIAARSLKNRKAPGPDGVPPEVIKELATNRPEILLRMYNSCLADGIFPNVWKEQKLVLISKGKGDQGSPSSYRPLCMLDTAGKLLERLIKTRLNEAIRIAGGLSNRQYGFRPGKSTLGALYDVISTVEDAQHGNHFSRPIILLATLDVKNAFNSLRWTDVIQTLETTFHIPEYLMRMIRDYLRNRMLTYDTTQGVRKMQITSGAAQGSILGPDLWNATYDEILKIEMPTDTYLVGYADDIAAVVKARNTEDAQRKLRQVMIRTKTWLDSHGMQLATHKTEVLLLTRRHIPIEMDIHLGDLVIPTKPYLEYLGVRLDSKLTYTRQLEFATSKAAKITTKLSRLMANIGGPLPSKRKLLMEACNSILLYGAELWAPTLQTRNRAKKLLSAQRTAALRVTSAYRTVSTQAVLVIAGMIPLDLQAIERHMRFKMSQNANPTLNAAIAREATVQKWQDRWRNEHQGRWTFRLLSDLEMWLNRRSGEVNYYITQMLSGHGYFRKYLHRMGKCSSPLCIYEAEEVIDDAEHTFFACCHWSEHRQQLEEDIGAISAANIVAKMLQSDYNWRVIGGFVEKVLRMKKRHLDTMT